MPKPTSPAEIADDIEARIRRGDPGYEPGDALPTYVGLANEYGVGRTTIAVVIMLLKERRLVDSKPGRAVFVRED